jgi:hypothetical protein
MLREVYGLSSERLGPRGDKIKIRLDQVDQNVTSWVQEDIMEIMIDQVDQNVTNWVQGEHNFNHN